MGAEMKKRRSPARSSGLGKPISWLPIDSRLLPPLFSFSHVRGIARFFLQLEIILATGIVVGTLCIAALKIILTLLK